MTSTIFVGPVSSTKNSTHILLLNSFVRIIHVWINNSSVHDIRREKKIRINLKNDWQHIFYFIYSNYANHNIIIVVVIVIFVFIENFIVISYSLTKYLLEKKRYYNQPYYNNLKA